ncbi:MAG: glutaminyl-peptide cyclotransferase [Acidimicrobiales bacterium]
MRRRHRVGEHLPDRHDRADRSGHRRGAGPGRRRRAAQPAEAAEADVLNGIAKVPGDGDTFLITGKNWPWTFEVRFVPA